MRTLKSNCGMSNELHRLTRMQMKHIIPDMKGRLLLDLGASDNRFCKLMQQDGVRTIGIDHDVRDKCDVHASVMHLPFANNTFDLVTAISVTDLLLDYERNTMLTEVNRVIKPGGYFVHSAGDIMKGSPSHWTQLGNMAISIFQICKGGVK